MPDGRGYLLQQRKELLQFLNEKNYIKMAKIITLGEIMLRLSPEGNDRFIQTDNFRIIPRILR